MAKVEIYTTRWCPYCHMAKRLLKKKDIAFSEIDVGGDAELRRRMVQRAGGGHTVPQIFIDDRSVGGCDELHSLDAVGDLNRMLGVVA